MPFNATLRLEASIALDHAVLDFDGAANSVHNASELNKDAIARPLDDAAVMESDGWIDQIAAERAHPRKGALFVGAGEPAVADYVTARMAASLRVPGTGSPSTAGESSTAHRS
jgi:hypothetical protein